MKLQGTVHKLGDSVDTDGMIAGRYLSILDPQELAPHIFEEIDPGFAGRVKPGDVIVAGKNFGCGSGREQAPFGLKALGISCIVATSFSRTFYRMAIDLGLPVLISAEVGETARQGQTIAVDTETGDVKLDGREFKTEPLPPFIQEIIDMGGIVDWVKAEVARRNANPSAAR